MARTLWGAFMHCTQRAHHHGSSGDDPGLISPQRFLFVLGECTRLMYNWLIHTVTVQWCYIQLFSCSEKHPLEIRDFVETIGARISSLPSAVWSYEYSQFCTRKNSPGGKVPAEGRKNSVQEWHKSDIIRKQKAGIGKWQGSPKNVTCINLLKTLDTWQHRDVQNKDTGSWFWPTCAWHEWNKNGLSCVEAHASC